MLSIKDNKSKKLEAALAEQLKKDLEEKLLHQFSVQPREATDAHLYNALVLVLRDRMRRRQNIFRP